MYKLYMHHQQVSLDPFFHFRSPFPQHFPTVIFLYKTSKPLPLFRQLLNLTSFFYFFLSLIFPNRCRSAKSHEHLFRSLPFLRPFPSYLVASRVWQVAELSKWFKRASFYRQESKPIEESSHFFAKTIKQHQLKSKEAAQRAHVKAGAVKLVEWAKSSSSNPSFQAIKSSANRQKRYSIYTDFEFDVELNSKWEKTKQTSPSFFDIRHWAVIKLK